MLTDQAIANLEPRSSNYKKADSGGLFVLVHRTGTKSFRLKYRLAGREKQAAFGQFPDVSLATARAMRDEAKRLLKAKRDPSMVRPPAISAFAAIGGLPIADDAPAELYFIQSRGTGTIKVGVSRNASDRLRDLQLATSDELVLLGVVRGSYAAEMAIHRMFAADRVRGEWFRASDRLLDFIAEYMGLRPCR